MDPATAQLQNLANLHAQGILTDEEYAAAKAKALGHLSQYLNALGQARTHRKGSDMADTQIVLGIFADEAAADAAVESLKSWDKVSDEVKLGAIGVLVVDADGQIKEHKLGARSTKKGAGIGLVLAVVAPPTLLVGLVGGGLLGRFHHKGLGLTQEDRERIGTELAGGKAAVGVLAPVAEAGTISAKLTELGGTAETYEVTDEALEAVADAVPDATEEPAVLA